MTATHPAGADAEGVERRTILAGAAWSIPVISVATAAPAFAATTDLSLAFDKSSYSGEGCKTISGVKVTATRNSVAAPGESVTVTLADGYTFEDGSKTFTAPTQGDGSITLPTIKVPARGGDSTLSATSGSTSASAPVSSTASSKTVAKNWQSNNTTPSTWSDVPSGATTVGSTFWLASNGDLYYANDRVASGVKNAMGENIGGADRVGWVTTDGVAKNWQSNDKTISTWSDVPSGATTVGSAFWLAPNGGLYYGNDKVASNVKNAVGEHLKGADRVGWVTTDGVAKNWQSNNTTPSTWSDVPSGATTVGSTFWLASNGDLYYANDRVASGVKNAMGENIDGADRVGWVTTDGVAKNWQSNDKTPSTWSDVPSGATTVGSAFWLAPNGELYYGNDKVASNVKNAVGEHLEGADRVGWSEYVC